MYCPQCGTQTEQKTKFCKSCGLKLADHARILEEPREAERMSYEQLRREKRMMSGNIFITSALVNMILFFIMFGMITLSHLEGRPYRGGLFMFLTTLLATLVTGGVGLAYLISGGFFKHMRERQLRIGLALLEEKRKALEEMNTPITQTIPGSSRMKAEPEMTGVTEHTTRELRQ
ncbi:MAG: hypothetical protein J2P52_09160 [Blastocatellia bacterium]|nr:hypothetical protein [Blastocatellia bacterium]